MSPPELAPGHPGWFCAARGEPPLELLRRSRPAFILAWIIAYRARWKTGYNRHQLDVGESMLGDHTQYGMSKQEYRTAKATLQAAGFAAFRSTSKGTIARLTDSSLFFNLSETDNIPVSTQINTLATPNPARQQHASSTQPSTPVTPNNNVIREQSKNQHAQQQPTRAREQGTGDGKFAPTIDEVRAHMPTIYDVEFCDRFYREMEEGSWFFTKRTNFDQPPRSFLKKWKSIMWRRKLRAIEQGKPYPTW